MGAFHYGPAIGEEVPFLFRFAAARIKAESTCALPFLGAQPAAGNHLGQLRRRFGSENLLHAWGFDPGRYQAPDDDIFLQPPEPVVGAADRCLGQHAGGLLEGGRGQEAVGKQRGPGDPQEYGLGSSRFATFRQHLAVLVLEHRLVHHLPRYVFRIARGLYRHPAEHLAQDDLNVLVVNTHPLGYVHLLYFIHQVALQFVLTPNMKYVVGIQRPGCQRIPGPYLLLIFHEDSGRGGNDVLAFLHILPDYGQRVRPQRDVTAVVGHYLLGGLSRFFSFSLLPLSRGGRALGQNHPRLNVLAVLHQ